MNVSLSDDLVEFVTQQTREGGYTNQSEVVREGLRLLRMQQQKRRALLAALEAGATDAAAERVRPLTDDALRQIAARGRRTAERRAKESRP